MPWPALASCLATSAMRIKTVSRAATSDQFMRRVTFVLDGRAVDQAQRHRLEKKKKKKKKKEKRRGKKKTEIKK